MSSMLGLSTDNIANWLIVQWAINSPIDYDIHLRTVVVLAALAVVGVSGYDPEDKLSPNGANSVAEGGPRFEAFYPRSAYGVPGGQSRPAHGHATFYQHRHPALVDAHNAPAYGFRFDGKRRFNYD